MKRYIFNTIFVILALLGTACEDLTDINENHNAVEPDKSDPNILLTTVITETATDYLLTGYDKFAGVMQHCQKDGWSGAFNDFDWDADSWSDYYGILRTNQLMINNSAKNDEFYAFHHAAGMIMKSYVFGMITDLWGDCPYTQALQGNGEYMTPVFDSQEIVYKGIIENLKQAISLMKESNAIDANSDPLYHGVPEMWKRFGNSLLLRYYMRLSNKLPDYAKHGFAEVVNANMFFSSIDDDAAISFPGNNMEDSWPFNLVYDDSQGSNYRRIKACRTLVENQREYSDPRIHVWFNRVETPTVLSDTVTVQGGEYDINGQKTRFFHPDSVSSLAVNDNPDYVGIPQNLKLPEVYNMNTNPQNQINPYVSYLNDQFREPKGEFLKARLMTYSEVCFLLAEAADKGWISGNVEDYYNDAVTASIEMWGAGGALAYLQQDGVKWGTGNWDEPLEQLINQKWISSFTYEQESWLDYLRTGYPKLVVGFNAKQKHIPYRYMYGDDESGYNTINYNDAIQRLEQTSYSSGQDDNPWSMPWLYIGVPNVP